MARSKNAAALFEVMKNGKGMASRESESGRPRLWFKQRDEAPETSSDPNDPTFSKIKSPLIALSVESVEIASRVADAPVAQPSSPRLASKLRSSLPQSAPQRSAASSGESSAALYFDRMRRELRIRLNLNGMIVTAFAMITVVGMAYVMGRHDAPPGIELSSSETVADNDASKPAPQPSALDLTRRPAKASAAAGFADGAGAHALPSSHARERDAGPALLQANSAQGMHLAPPTAEGALTEDMPRTIGVNYVIAQSYPNQQQATDAHDFLAKSGIPCTVEKGPQGWANPNWYSVVTLRGFEHIHTPECEAFRHQIEKLGDKFAGNGKFKRFDPFLYSWK